MRPDGVEIQHDDDRGRMAFVGPILFSMTRRPPTVASVSRLHVAMRTLHERVGPLCLLVVPAASRPRLDEDVRAKIRETWAAADSLVAAAAFCVTRGAFAGAIQRSAITAVTMARRGELPTRVFASVEPSVTWLGDYSTSIRDATPQYIETINHLVQSPPPK